MNPAQNLWFRALFQKQVFLLQPQPGPESVLHGLSRAAGCWAIGAGVTLEHAAELLRRFPGSREDRA